MAYTVLGLTIMFVKKKYSQGAGIIFYKKENDQVFVVLGLRKGKPHAGFWSFAGGKLDPTDRSYFDCALREAKEEFFNHRSEYFNLISSKNLIPKKRISFNAYFIRWDAYFVDVTDIPLAFERQKSEIDEISWYNINQLPLNTHFLIHVEICLARMLNFFK